MYGPACTPALVIYSKRRQNGGGTERKDSDKWWEWDSRPGPFPWPGRLRLKADATIIRETSSSINSLGDFVRQMAEHTAHSAKLRRLSGCSFGKQ